MTPSEKILEAIKDAREYVKGLDFENLDKSGIDICMSSVFDCLNRIVKQADAIKDRFSEEDVNQLKEAEKLHLNEYPNSNRLMTGECIGCWRISERKRYMGIT